MRRCGGLLVALLWQACGSATADLTVAYYDVAEKHPQCTEGHERYILDCVFHSHFLQYALSDSPKIDERNTCADQGYEFVGMDSSFPQAKTYWKGGLKGLQDFQQSSYVKAHPNMASMLNASRDGNPACAAADGFFSAPAKPAIITSTSSSEDDGSSMAAGPPSVAAVVCNSSDAAQGWSYHENAFLTHQATGLTLVATGGESDKTPSAPVLSNTPQMEPAQWMYNQSNGQLHAFRGNGNRCLALQPIGCPGGDPPGQPQTLSVVTCDDPSVDVSPEQRFPTFFPDLDPHRANIGRVMLGCMDLMMCLMVVNAAPESDAAFAGRSALSGSSSLFVV